MYNSLMIVALSLPAAAEGAFQPRHQKSLAIPRVHHDRND